MKFRRPRSLNGLILVGFGFVALPLLLAVIWALVNLDRVAEQSERLVFTGVTTAENNRRIEEQLNTMERVALQYQVLRNPDSLMIMREDLEALQAQLTQMAPLVEEVLTLMTGEKSLVEATVTLDNVAEADHLARIRSDEIMTQRA